MNKLKQQALEKFKDWIASTKSDLHFACEAAQINGSWPDVVLEEGDNDFALGEYVGWMAAWQAAKAEADEEKRELVEALKAARRFIYYDEGFPMDWSISRIDEVLAAARGEK